MSRVASLLTLAAISTAAACGEPRVAGPGEVGGGLDAGPWENVTSNLAGEQSECGNLSWLSARPDRDELIAGIARHGLWSLPPGSSAWAQLGTGAGSASIVNRPTQVIYDPSNAGTFWEAGIYNSFGIYRTTDDGRTFTQLGLGSGSGGVNCCDEVSIDLTDPGRRTMLAGSHENSGHLFRSLDAGASWVDLGANLPAGNGYASFPLVLSARVFLLGTWTSPGAGIFRSTDGGASWTRVSSVAVRSHPLVASDGSLFWVADANAGVTRSTDQGATWSQAAVAGRLLTTTAGIAELPDGRLAGPGVDGHVLVSGDHGQTWQPIKTLLPIQPTGLLYSQRQKAFYAWYWTCNLNGDPVPADAIQRLAFP